MGTLEKKKEIERKVIFSLFSKEGIGACGKIPSSMLLYIHLGRHHSTCKQLPDLLKSRNDLQNYIHKINQLGHREKTYRERERERDVMPTAYFV